MMFFVHTFTSTLDQLQVPWT